MSNYRKTTLGNGVTVVTEQHSQVRSVCMGVWVKVGSSHEHPDSAGTSHFIEHMVFKGTERRTPLEIATVLESLGGDLNAFTDREYTCFHATVLSEHLDIAMDVISDLVMRPTFPKEELERERLVLLQELSMIEESPDEFISDLFFETVWKGQPLGRTIIGSRKTIKGIGRSLLLNYFRKHYTAENMVVSIAGNFDFDVTLANCEKFFGAIPKGAGPVKVRKPSPPSVYQARNRYYEMETEQLHLLMGYEGVGFKDPRRFDALVLSFFLGGGMSSRLFQEIREKQGLAYSVDCECIPFAEGGILSIYCALAPKNLKKAIDIVHEQIDNLRKISLTEKDLAIVKGQLRGAILLSDDQMETRQESLGRNEVIYGQHVSVEEVIKELEQVDGARIQKLVNELIVPEKEAIIALGKPSEKIKKLLRELAPRKSGRVSHG